MLGPRQQELPTCALLAKPSQAPSEAALHLQLIAAAATFEMVLLKLTVTFCRVTVTLCYCCSWHERDDDAQGADSRIGSKMRQVTQTQL